MVIIKINVIRLFLRFYIFDRYEKKERNKLAWIIKGFFILVYENWLDVLDEM